MAHHGVARYAEARRSVACWCVCMRERRAGMHSIPMWHVRACHANLHSWCTCVLVRLHAWCACVRVWRACWCVHWRRRGMHARMRGLGDDLGFGVGDRVGGSVGISVGTADNDTCAACVCSWSHSPWVQMDVRARLPMRAQVCVSMQPQREANTDPDANTFREAKH